MTPPLSPFRLVYIFCRAFGLSLVIASLIWVLGDLTGRLGLGNLSLASGLYRLPSFAIGLLLWVCAPGLSALLTGQNALRGEAIHSDLGSDLFSRRLVWLFCGVLVSVSGATAFTSAFMSFAYYNFYENASASLVNFFSWTTLVLPFLHVTVGLMLIWCSGFPQGRFLGSESETDAN